MGHIVKCEWGSVPAALAGAEGCREVEVQEYVTAQEMMASTCLKLGYAHTLGFHEVGDGGAAYYTVVASATGDEPNGMDVLECRKGFVAELVSANVMNTTMMGNPAQLPLDKIIAKYEFNYFDIFCNCTIDSVININNCKLNFHGSTITCRSSDTDTTPVFRTRAEISC